MGVISELKRRNVFRMAVLYVVAAWLIMQVAEAVVGLANPPEWVGHAILALLAIGLPIALVFAWFFELTPEGLALEKNVVISLLSAALVMFAYDKWWPEGVLQRTIAVLPFDNMSPDNETTAFLANGIQDDLLTRLSKIADLKVISRTSVERYRDTTTSMRQIGAELGAGKILEGGVQRAGDQIRINVQLIDSATDEHLWAQTYDRTLTASNVFAIQTDIVDTIVEQLDASLTPQETRQLAAMPTHDLAAYTAYLRGRNKADIESVESLNAAIADFEQAVTLDPDFALAYVGLADAYLTLGAYFYGGLSTDESIALAEPPVVRALQLDDSLGQAYAVLGYLRQEQGDWQSAASAYEKAISLQPNYSRVFGLFGRMRWREQRHEEAMALFQKAMRIDPYSAPVNYVYARSLEESGRFDEALARYLQVVETKPNHAFAYVYIAAIHYLVYGRADESLIWYHKAAANDALSPSLQSAPAIVFLELDDPESARYWVRKGIELGPETFWSVWASLLLNVHTGEDAAALRDARTLLEAYPRNWGALNLLRNADLAAGRYDVALSRYARSHRELMDPLDPDVNAFNLFAAVDLALVLERHGEHEHANAILERSLNVIEKRPRLGTSGYWITDVRIYAQQQRPARALRALRRAIDEGWRVFVWYYLQYDPNLDSIRDLPEFRQLYDELQADLATQAKRVEDLRSSGELPAIPAAE